MSHGAYRENHPLPAMLMHWVHLLSMFALGFTGFFIHYPFFDANMQLMRTLHFVFMYIVIANLVVRMYWAFFGKGSTLMKGTREIDRDFKNFGPQKVNKGQFLELLKYYLFMRKTHPYTAKFNALQKGTYIFWALLLLAQAYTGFAIYGPFLDVGFFAAGTAAVGSLMIMRQIHFLIMWVFIITTAIHVYLVFAEDLEQLPLMFWGKETPAKH